MHQRRTIRVGPKLIHRHRVGRKVFRRVSELVFIQGRPRAILGWINLAGIRTPLYISELDPAKLKPSPDARNVYYYEGVTADPRYPDPEDDDPSALPHGGA